MPLFEEQSDCFALNGDIYNPEVKGIRGALKSYKNAVKQCELANVPVKMSDILRNMNNYCSELVKTESQYLQRYNILLILTNQEVNDIKVQKELEIEKL